MRILKLKKPILVTELAIQNRAFETDLLILAKEQLETKGFVDIYALTMKTDRSYHWVEKTLWKLLYNNCFGEAKELEDLLRPTED